MTHLDLLLPFALPPAELARDLLGQLKLPALATLLSRGQSSKLQAEPYARLLPHQQWLLDRRDTGLFGPGIARAAMQALGLEADAGKWFVLHPCHFHIARDHLVLTDLRQLDLPEAQAQQLFAATKPLFDEAGLELVYGQPKLWFLRADAWGELDTAAPDCAVGHNIDIWMPRGAGERAWRRLHNEVQMLWHTHEVNEERQARGANPVNALWCWDAGAQVQFVAQQAPQQAAPLQDAALPAFLPTLFAAPVPIHGQAATQLTSLLQRAGPALAVVDRLSQPALAADWGAWLGVMQALEDSWFQPLLSAMKSGGLASIDIVASNEQGLLTARCSRLALKKFWVAPSLSLLAPGAAPQQPKAARA